MIALQSTSKSSTPQKSELPYKGRLKLGIKERPIKALSEIVLRVKNLAAMREFYENTVGLELLQNFDNIVFFRIASGYGGLTQFLVLFDQSVTADHRLRQYTGLDPEKTSLHHIAFAISLSNYYEEYDRLLGLGLDVEMGVHEWVHYRSLYFCDPDGNVVELVCYDESVQSS
jgi:catechol 2,3-dioxygenase-like lactoylglutathione lyase family enzyme